LLNIADADVISAFLFGTANETLVQKLGQKCPRTTKELLDIATSHASDEDAVGVIFDRSKAKAKRNEDADEGASNRSDKKKKKKKRREGLLMAAVEWKDKWTPTEGTLDHFKKMLKGICPNHTYPVKHAYKDCGLMKKFLAGGSKKGEQKKPDTERDDAKGEDSAFPQETSCLMIFGGPESYASKRCQKLERWEVYEVEPATPTFLKWSRLAITFDWSNHPKSIPRLG
jgi:hypothetical protein